MIRRRFLAITLGLLMSMAAVNAMAATEEDIEASIEAGIAWLVDQQNVVDGSWVGSVAHTGLALLKLEDRAFELGYDSPFDPGYQYSHNVIEGLNYLFENAKFTAIFPQPAGNPDANGNRRGIYWGLESFSTYHTGIAMMAIAASRYPDEVVTIGPFVGSSYKLVLQDAVDYLASGQVDAPSLHRGGWGYAANESWAENSNSGYAVLGIAYAESPEYGFECTVLPFVKDELSIWIDYIQNDVNDDDDDGGSGYDHPESWVNILKTGNLLHQMAFVGDVVTDQRVIDAIDYIERHWDDPNTDPGWRGDPVHKQATFCAMKGLEVFVIEIITVGGVDRDWYDEFADALIKEQQADGSWLWDYWGDKILGTTWALLTLQRVVPPPPAIRVSIDIKPQSCPNPINVTRKGVLPVAILGTEDFDVTQVDPASVKLEGVYPIRWSLEDVATPYDLSPERPDAYDCTEAGPDGFTDLSLKFDALEVVAALGDVNDGDVLVLTLTGNLKEEFSGTAIKGMDVVIILKKGKSAPASLASAAGAPFPTPSNPEVWIPYKLGGGVDVSITIYNASGRLIRTFDLGYQNAGAYISKGKAAHWDGKNEMGEEVSSGIYFYTIKAGDFIATRKIVMAK